MIYLLPVLISILQGFFLLVTILPPAERPRMPLLLFWGSLIGMGTTALFTFTSFLFFNQLVTAYVIGLNIAVTLLLAWLARRNGITSPFAKGAWDTGDLIGLHILLLFHIPVVLYALIYPDGGWDAWSCWNLKAKFLFMGGEDWRGMMDPALWRSNISYPILLPLINVWSWCFGSGPTTTIPMITSCRISFLMSGIMFFGLKESGKNISALLAPLWALSITFFILLASSQYSDLLVGTWLLGTILGFKLFVERRSIGYLSTMLISLGLMSFTKSEGLVLSMITIGICALAILLSPVLKKAALISWKNLLVTLIIAFLPTIIFQFFRAGDSHTFINGLTSADKPASIERLQAIFVFLGLEMTSSKWNGFWIMLPVGIILAGTKAFNRGLWVIPMIIGIYMLSVVGVYAINTFFPVIWWLSTTLNRILFAMLPMLIFWLFAGIETTDDPSNENPQRPCRH